jgi:hypothetical protein
VPYATDPAGVVRQNSGVRPISLPSLALGVAELAAARPGWVRVAVDGADAVEPAAFADALVEPIRLLGRAVQRVRAEDHLRPASLRFEHGRTDPDSLYDDWLDVEGLRREVLDPLSPGGSGRIRPARWHAGRDRARRDPFVEVPMDAVLILSGSLLLGHGLPIDLSVHLYASGAALRRRTPADRAWTLPAYDRYAREVAPADWADVVVRVEDPHHPALARFPT